jgi:hypothetical protein
MRNSVAETPPDYIEARIRQHPPEGIPIVYGSTPVIAFGDVRKSLVATLGWNPSKLEFLGNDGRELVGNERRLETLASIHEPDLARASDESVRRVFRACNTYFKRRPYRWFSSLEKVLKHVGASYYDGSACHLDLVQWATDPVWGKLSRTHQSQLLKADLPFLNQQLSQENIRVLLLNGRGIVSAYRELLHGTLLESSIPGHSRLSLFTGHDSRGFMVIGWNINLQSSFGVSNYEIEAIGSAVRERFAIESASPTPQDAPPQNVDNSPPQTRWWRFWAR